MSKFTYSEMDNAFNTITLRERIIIFCALIFCTVAILYFWLLEPAMVQHKKAMHTLQRNYQQEKVISNDILQTTQRLQKDPLKEINQKIAFTETTIAQLDKQLDEKLVKFIHAQKMPIALTNVLSNTPGVRISALKSLPVKIFKISAQKVDNVTQKTFYRHTLEITLQGDYNAIYQYVLNVENLKDKFYWYSVDYQVDTYPLAEVVIQIYTLSDQQDLVSG